jgi:uncharacterized cofD-like protein
MKIVAIGGGTGLSTLLSGLRRFVGNGAASLSSEASPLISKLTAVVAVTDDGGSSGRLRKEFNVLSPGDIRNCLVAMSQADALLGQLFQYRFQAGAGLEGHTLGNLFVTALAALTGDFALAVKVSSAVMNVCGAVYPATAANVDLLATMDDGTVVEGETNIASSARKISTLHMAPKDPDPLPQTLEAIRESDIITVGPGSLYTSLIPNLLVKGIPEAIAKSRARRIYICNLMTQPGETLGMTAADHIRAMYTHAKEPIFDCAFLDVTPVPSSLQARYSEDGAEQVRVDTEAIRALGVTPIIGHFLEENGGVARHAPEELAKALLTHCWHSFNSAAVRDSPMPLQL